MNALTMIKRSAFTRDSMNCDVYGTTLYLTPLAKSVLNITGLHTKLGGSQRNVKAIIKSYGSKY
jgi:hypothetical protein